MPFLLPGLVLALVTPPTIYSSNHVTDIVFAGKQSFNNFEPIRFAKEKEQLTVIFENNDAKSDQYLYCSIIEDDRLAPPKRAYHWNTPTNRDENGITSPSSKIEQSESLEFALLRTSRTSTLFLKDNKYYLNTGGVTKELGIRDFSGYYLLFDNRLIWLTSEDQGNLAVNSKSADADTESVNIPNFGWLSLDFTDQSVIRIGQDKIAFFARCSYQYLTTKFLCILDLRSNRIVKRIAIEGGPLPSGHGFPHIRNESLCNFDGKIYYLDSNRVIHIDPKID